ncbi:hypothetical protein BHK98_03110 [Hornefia porci]|uniref:DUF4125 family protein n=1 Tax=Hornefia porci TaxID=2652292 RepID=A0A1Q9JFX7_9FIRM|nr:DUF4125 family protein [Hornefia porci]OLR55140.1 hypothetical protein BHK98_03110 [Hornefia porci]
MGQVQRNGSGKDRLINEIIALEWDMFQRVENIGGRAGCQDDWNTFYIMRYSQDATWSEDTLRSYLNDLKRAEASGRNLLTEKYAYMMEFTDPEYYREHLQASLPALSEQKGRLIAEIVGLQLISHRKFAGQFPRIAGAGRPVGEDRGETSVKSYSIGELKTYSEETLRLLLRDVKQNPDMVLDIQRSIAEFYGYSGPEAAEQALAGREDGRRSR